MKNGWIIFLIIIAFAACRRKSNETATIPSGAVDTVALNHASNFSIVAQGGQKVIRIFEPWDNARDTLTYLLKSDEKAQPIIDDYDFEVNTPLKKVVVLSTTTLSFIELIGEASSVKGFANPNFITSDTYQKRVASGDIRDVGQTSSLNYETILDINPDAVITFSMGNDISNYDVIKNAGIPIIYAAEFIEKTPLGRAEWIKFISAFYNQPDKADSTFQLVETNYNTWRQKTQHVEQKPTAFCGVVYGDIWYMPGGNNWSARFIEDAGGNYLWSHTKNTRSVKLSFEAVYEKAHDADYWIGTGTLASLDEVKAADKRYSKFQAFKQGHVYTNNKWVTDKGGNAYFEIGYARPDLILKDFVKIFHPDIVGDSTSFTFYQKLN